MKWSLAFLAGALSIPSYAAELAKITKMALGDNFSCALFDNGKVKCWGQGSRGVLGQGNPKPLGASPNELGSALPYIDLGTGFNAVSIVAGSDHVCALSDAHKLKCWGSNTFGNLGIGGGNRGSAPQQMGDNLPYVDLGDGVITEIASHRSHTCAVFSDGRLKCWGRNGDGQLGLEDNINHGETTAQMGAALPYVNLGDGVKVKHVYTGLFHTCALTTDSKVMCWGSGVDGQTGAENADRIGNAPGSMGNALKPIKLSAPAVDFCSTIYHNCALLADGTTRCFGFENSAGRLGSGLTSSLGNQADSMGLNLPTTPLSSGFVTNSISCGGRASCGLLENGGLKCWGVNDAGGIGLGFRSSIGADRTDMGDNLPYVNLGTQFEVQAVYHGGLHTCVLAKSGQAKCFGNNASGQLGLGDTVMRGRNPKDMGDQLPYLKLQ